MSLRNHIGRSVSAMMAPRDTIQRWFGHHDSSYLDNIDHDSTRAHFKGNGGRVHVVDGGDLGGLCLL